MKLDPLRHEVNGAFRFWVELDGLLVAGFSEVTGLQIETEVEEFAEGGVNEFVHRLPRRVRYQPIVLKRGLTQSNALWNWYDKVRNGKVQRKSGSVILYSHNMNEVCRWNFYDSYPSKWIGPNLSAASNDVALETVELVHNGLEVVFSGNSDDGGRRGGRP